MYLKPPESECLRCRGAGSPDTASRAVSATTSVITSGLALLPSLTCPPCLAAYAGLLSSAGLGFVLQGPALQPVVAAFLAVNLAALAWTARSHRSLIPLGIATIGSAGVLVGQLIGDVPAARYAGSGALLVAAAWNLWLKRPGAGAVQREVAR